MFGLGWIKMLGIGVVFVGFGFIVFMGWQYHTATQGRITELIAKNNVLIESNAVLQSSVDNLNSALETSNATIDELKQDQEEVRLNFHIVDKQFSEINQRNRDLEDVISAADLTSANDITVLENLVNGAMTDSWRCFELQTGARFTEDEKNANAPKDANAVCPWLLLTTE